VGGRVALRLCTINPRTTFEDVERTIAHMERYPVLPPRLDSRHATFYE
jgi:hypothetical protein